MMSRKYCSVFTFTTELTLFRESTFEFVLHRDKILTSSWSFSADMADGSKTGQRPKYC